MHSLITFLAIFILGTSQGLSIWWVHGLAVILALSNLHKVSHYYFFWLLLALALFTATEPRFSTEYLLLKMGFAAWALQTWWVRLNDKQKTTRLIIIFAGLIVAEGLDICFSEKGSALLWLPVFLVLYCPLSLSKKNLLVYSFSAIGLVVTKKISALIAFASLFAIKIKNKIFLVIGFLIAAGVYFTLVESFHHFFSKSLAPRLYIWASCAKGFIHAPLWGHGFGTLPIDIPIYRILSNVWGARGGQQLAHGHSLFAHYAFEQGLIGLVLIFAIFALVYKQARPAFIPLLIISLFDSPLVTPHQFLLASLLIAPWIKIDQKNFIFRQIPTKLVIPSRTILSLLAGIIFVSSIVGHFYYDHKDYDNAIKWDKYHSLYYLMRGSYYLNKDTLQSEKDFERAVDLSPNIGYFYGFLGAGKLANLKIPEAKTYIKKAIKFSGENAYWHVMSAFINLAEGNKDLYQRHMDKAIAENPDIPFLLKNPQYSSNLAIGADKADVRVSGFYRRGVKLFVPMPYTED